MNCNKQENPEALSIDYTGRFIHELILYLVTCDEPDWSKSVGYIPTLFIAHA